MISTAIIGVSGFAKVHYMDLLSQVAAGKMQATAATIINQEEEAEKCRRLEALGCKLYTDYKQMFDECGDELDLAMIPTGIALHAPMTIAALSAGVNVLVEKPIAGTLQEVDAMAEAARAAGKFVAVGYQNMYDTLTMEIKERILAGEIGELQHISCWALWPRDTAYYERNSWAGCLKSGDSWILDSPINNAMAHFLMQMLFFAGHEARECVSLQSVEGELYRAQSIESFDTASLRVIATTGIPIFFSATHCSNDYKGPDVVIQGSKGKIGWQPGKAVIYREEGSAEEIVGAKDQRTILWDSVADRVNGGDSFTCDLSLARAHTLCVNALHDATPIHNIAAELTSTHDSRDGVQTTIAGIEDVVQGAAKQLKLFSELGVEWAQAPGSMDMAGYTAFQGTNC